METASLDPVVVGALISLRQFRNDVSHPNDLPRVGLTFRRLVKSGIEYDPNDIQNWLLQDGWTREEAYRVIDLADYEKYVANREDLNESVIESWRERGKAATNE